MIEELMERYKKLPEEQQELIFSLVISLLLNS